jgi:hypothetical protein
MNVLLDKKERMAFTIIVSWEPITTPLMIIPHIVVFQNTRECMWMHPADPSTEVEKYFALPHICLSSDVQTEGPMPPPRYANKFNFVTLRCELILQQ